MASFNDTVRKVDGLLKRAAHPETPEHEALAARTFADRLMAKHNISEADMAQVEFKTVKPRVKKDLGAAARKKPNIFKKGAAHAD